MAKFCFLFVVIFAILAGASCLNSVQKTRKGKLLFPYIVNIVAGPCHNAGGYYGTCYSSYECKKRGGFANGMCAKNYGVCCVGMVTCNDQVVLNDTYFQNPNYPSSMMGGGDCAVTVRRQPNICQIRIDFIDFNLPKPDDNGVCKDARFTVTDNNYYSQTGLPQPCGQFSNQHMYVNFDGSDYIRLNYMGMGTKSWRTRIQMIECTSLLRAPDGCLQYYYDNGGMGQVEILGYNSKQPPHLANLNYTLCVRREVRRDSITWEVCDAKSFSMSGDATMPAEAFQDTPFCMNDYIQMLGRAELPSSMGPGYSDNVFCGTALSRLQANPPPSMNQPITTSAKPFVIHVETDAVEDPNGPSNDVMNVGFCLTYRQG